VKGDRLPPAHHVARHCYGKKGLDFDETGKPIGVLPAAFHVDDDGVSVNWVEHYPGNFLEQLNATRRVIKETRNVDRKKHRLAILGVERIEQTGALNGAQFWAEHDPTCDPPEDRNPGHSLIKGLEVADGNQWQVLCSSIELVTFDCDPAT